MPQGNGWCRPVGLVSQGRALPKGEGDMAAGSMLVSMQQAPAHAQWEAAPRPWSLLRGHGACWEGLSRAWVRQKYGGSAFPRLLSLHLQRKERSEMKAERQPLLWILFFCEDS